MSVGAGHQPGRRGGGVIPVARLTHSFESDGCGGSRSQRTPGKIKTAPDGAPTPFTQGLTPLLPNRKGLVVHATRLRGHLYPDPTVVPTSIGHLDHLPVCGSTAHKTYRPPAEYWYDQHGCFDMLVCGRCMTSLYRRFETHLRSGGKSLECTVCHRDFYTLDSLYRAVPLGGGAAR